MTGPKEGLTCSWGDLGRENKTRIEINLAARSKQHY